MVDMDEDIFKQKLKEYNLNTDDACALMYIKTRYFIRPDNIQKQIERQGKLSKALSVAFMLFFNELEREIGKV